MNANVLLLGVLTLSLFGAGQVWLVQISSYPLWRYVGETQFPAYHRAWWRSIQVVVLGPALLTLVGALLMLRWRPPEAPLWWAWAGAGLQIAVAVGTALWWAPLMARLEGPGGGPDPQRFRLLLNSHWLRVGLITAHSALLASMALRIMSSI